MRPIFVRSGLASVKMPKSSICADVASSNGRATHRPRHRDAALWISASVLALSPAGAAFAQDDDEIVVTATKRAESIQQVPLAITALDGELTREINLDDVKDLVSFTPGVTGNSFDSFIDQISIRGIITNDFGVGGDPSVGIFKNGLYQGRNGAVVTSLFDVERAEVLRGPQGFLFGRNSIGGAISVVTTRPKLDVVEGYAEFDVGQRSRFFGEGAINVPLTDNLAVRLALYGGQEDGYVDNVARPDDDPLIAQEKYAGRLSALYSKGPFEALFTAEYESRFQSGSVYRATGLGDSFDALVDLFGLTIGGDGRDIDSDLGFGERDDANIFSLGLQLDYDLGFATLQSLTGYKDHNYDYAEDFDGTPLRINDYAQQQEGEYFEQEIRVISNNDGPLSWYAGVSYYNESIDAEFAQGSDEETQCIYYLSYYGFNSCSEYFAYYGYAFTPNPDGLVETNQVRGRYDGWAAYVDATYKVSEKFDVGVGLRFTRDTKRFAINAPAPESELGPFFALGFTTTDFLEDEQSWEALTPRFVARYFANDDLLFFGSVTRGFKAGGFGSFAIFPDQPFGTLDVEPGQAGPDPFDPERAWSYEVGTKGTAFNGAVKFDGNVYYYDYRDLQQVVPGTGGGIVVDNVGEVTGWGVEGSVQTDLGPYFDLYLAGAYADTEVNEAQALCDGTDLCEGSSLPQVPLLSGSAILRFTYPAGPGSIRANAEVFGQTETFGGLLALEEARNEGYADLALRVGYVADNGVSIFGYVENVTNVLYYTGVAEGSGILPAHFFGPSRPRTFGVRLNFAFGGG